jgi:hypothetical protein
MAPSGRIMVCCRAAQREWFPSRRTCTSTRVTNTVPPFRRTRPSARRRSPRAGRRKLILYSRVSTSLPEGSKARAAHPPATSPSVPISPPWKKPCCCPASGENGSSRLHVPEPTAHIVHPSSIRSRCRLKLSRTSCSFPGGKGGVWPSGCMPTYPCTDDQLLSRRIQHRQCVGGPHRWTLSAYGSRTWSFLQCGQCRGETVREGRKVSTSRT